MKMNQLKMSLGLAAVVISTGSMQGANVALISNGGAVEVASSVGGGNYGDPNNAINGDNTSSMWEHVNNSTVPQFIEISLGAYPGEVLNSLFLGQRNDGNACCDNRLTNFTVTFLDDSTANGGNILHSVVSTTQVPQPGQAYALPNLTGVTHVRLEDDGINTAHFHVGAIDVFSVPIPEPSSSALLALSALGFVSRRRR